MATVTRQAFERLRDEHDQALCIDQPWARLEFVDPITLLVKTTMLPPEVAAVVRSYAIESKKTIQTIVNRDFDLHDVRSNGVCFYQLVRMHRRGCPDALREKKHP
jgi:hypothetical protein